MSKPSKFKKPSLPAGTAGAREAWLETGYREYLAPLLIQAALDAGEPFRVAPPIRVTCGWPSKGAMPGGKKTRIGECWDARAAADKVAQIFISPLIEKPVEALDVLLHENIHAFVGTKCGHRGPFAAIARAVGLEGKLTATFAGPALKAKLEAIAKKLGPYPHVKLNPGLSGLKHQKNRHALATCPGCDYKIRLSRKVAEERGLPVCPCGERFILQGSGGGAEEEGAAEAGNRRPAAQHAARKLKRGQRKVREVVEPKPRGPRGPCTWENRFGFPAPTVPEGCVGHAPHGFDPGPALRASLSAPRLGGVQSTVGERRSAALALIKKKWKGCTVTDNGDYWLITFGTTVARLLK